jgi:Tfp pilus assembly protein FimT
MACNPLKNIALRACAHGGTNALTGAAEEPECTRAIEDKVTNRDLERKSRRNGESGYSIVELLIVCGIIIVVSGMATVQMMPVWQQFQADSALAEMKGALRQARETAISQRRTIAVKFANNNTIQLYQWVVTLDSSGNPSQVLSTTPFSTIPIQNKAVFMTFSSAPDLPAPDNIGLPTSSGLEFGGNTGVPTSGLAFQSDGTFTDGNGVAINGSIFIGIAGIQTTARAISILGATGRIRPYRYSGKGWFQ